MGAVSVLFPQQPVEMKGLLSYGRLVQESSAQRLWMGQSLRIESHPALAYLAGSGCRVPVGIGVGLMVLRSPFDAAVQARSLAALMEQPVTIGYGAAERNFVTSVRGAAYERPARAVEEYLTVLRALVSGEPVDHRGELFTVRQSLPPLSHPPVEVGAGVLRPAMARAAGRSADAAVTWLTPPAYLREVLLPVMAQAAEGRQRPPRVCAFVQVAVARPGRNPMLMAQLGAGGHLQAEHYTDMLRRAGLDVHASDPASGARELVEGGVFVYGSPAQIAARVREYHDAGVDEVVLNPTGVAGLYGADAAGEDLHRILAEFP